MVEGLTINANWIFVSFFANPQLHKIVVLSIDRERPNDRERKKEEEKEERKTKQNRTEKKKNKNKTINRGRLNQFKYYLNNRSAVEVKLIF